MILCLWIIVYDDADCEEDDDCDQDYGYDEEDDTHGDHYGYGFGNNDAYDGENNYNLHNDVIGEVAWSAGSPERGPMRRKTSA